MAPLKLVMDEDDPRQLPVASIILVGLSAAGLIASIFQHAYVGTTAVKATNRGINEFRFCSRVNSFFRPPTFYRSFSISRLLGSSFPTEPSLYRRFIAALRNNRAKGPINPKLTRLNPRYN